MSGPAHRGLGPVGFIHPSGTMPFPVATILAVLIMLGIACTNSSIAEPTSAPPLSAVTPLATASPLPRATELITIPPTPLPTLLPTSSPLPAATELSTPTALPVAGETLPATELPTALLAPTPLVLPTAEAVPEMHQSTVTIGDKTWPVELAITTQEKAQGLSGREVLPEGTGMLFIYDSDRPLSFWMPDMNFPLDMVWIDSTCRVVDATLNAPVPEPGQSRNDLPRFSPRSPAMFVLEINAGEFWEVGTLGEVRVEFGGAIAGEFGC